MDELVDFGQDYIKGLLGIRVRRIRRTIQFENLHTYSLVTSLTLINVGKDDCWIVPSEVYPKGNLVNFQATDSMGAHLPSVPSYYRTHLLVSLALYRIIQGHLRKIAEEGDEESFRSKALEGLLILLESSKSEPKFNIQPSDVIKMLVRGALASKTNLPRHFGHEQIVGFLKKYPLDDLFSCWLIEKVRLGIGLSSDHFKKPLAKLFNDIGVKEEVSVRIKESVRDLSLGWFLGEEVSNNIQNMKERILPLLFLSSPIKRNQIRTITTTTTHFIPESNVKKHAWIDRTVTLDLPMHIPIYGTKHACHLHVKPPEELEFRYNTLLPSTKDDGEEWIEPLSKQTIRTESFAIIHEDNTVCTTVLNSAGLVEYEEFEKHKNGIDIDDLKELRKKIPPPNEPRTRLDSDIMASYFGPTYTRNRKTREYPDCTDNHKLRLRITSNKDSVVLSVWHTIVWVSLSLLLGYSLAVGISYSSYALLIVAGLSQTLATFFHIFSKPRAAQELIKKPLKYSLYAMGTGFTLYLIGISLEARIHFQQLLTPFSLNLTISLLLIGLAILLVFVLVIYYVKGAQKKCIDRCLEIEGFPTREFDEIETSACVEDS